jgi:Protein of unknown function (DUF3800)
VHLAFLDDSGTHPDKKTKFQVMTGVIIEGWEFRDIELVMGVMVEELVPEERRHKFEEFHAWELFGGCNAFEGVDQQQRFDAVQSILYAVADRKAPIVYGAVDIAKLAAKIYSSADPLDICFRLCIQGIDLWASQHIRSPIATNSKELQDAQPLVVLICDDFQHKTVKDSIKKSFRQLRSKVRPPDYDTGKTWHLHDDLYFGNSRDSIGIQLSDLCAYIIRRHLEGDPAVTGFYNTIRECIYSFKVEPSDDLIALKNDTHAKGKSAQ